MNRRKWIIGLLLLVPVLMYGCGINEEKGKNQTNSTTKVEDPVASAVFKNSDTTVKESWYENDYTRIYTTSPEECTEVWAYKNRTDGKYSQKDDKGYFNDFIPTLQSVMWITNDWLYYIDESDGGIYRVPILYEKEMLQLEVKKKEYLFPSEDEEYHANFLVTDSYVVGLSMEGDDWDEVWVRYDLKTKELTKLDMPEKIISTYCYMEVQKTTGLPVVLKDSFFASFDTDSEKAVLYRISLDTMKGEKICTDYNEFGAEPLAVHGSDLYIVDRTGILRYDGNTGNLTRVLENDMVRRQFDETKLLPENVQEKTAAVDSVYSLHDRLYAGICVKWNRKEPKGKGYAYKTWGQIAQDEKNTAEGKMVECEYEETVLMSADHSDLGNWEQETKLYEYMQQHGAFDLDWKQDREPGEAYNFEQSFFLNKVTNDQIYFEYVDVERYKEEDDDTVETSAIYKFADGSVQVGEE